MNGLEALKPYLNPPEIVEVSNGFITWRLGTGKAIEILHLKVLIPRQGTGRELLTEMLIRLRENPPHDVYGFTWADNIVSRKFYSAMGFKLSLVKGVYRDGISVIFSSTYQNLWERHCEKY